MTGGLRRARGTRYHSSQVDHGGSGGPQAAGAAGDDGVGQEGLLRLALSIQGLLPLPPQQRRLTVTQVSVILVSF